MQVDQHYDNESHQPVSRVHRSIDPPVDSPSDALLDLPVRHQLPAPLLIQFDISCAGPMRYQADRYDQQPRS